MLLRRIKTRILVADEDEDFLDLTRSVLEFAGFKVETAKDGNVALKLLRSREYDLLILDVVMPKIDGVRLFQMARKSKRYARISVLSISGHSSIEGLEDRPRI